MGKETPTDLGQLDKSKEGSNGNEADKPGAFAVVLPDGSILVNTPDHKQDAKHQRKETASPRQPDEEKEEVTEIPNSDNRDASMGRTWRDRRPRQSDSEEEEEEEEEETEDRTPGAFAFSNEEGNLVRRRRGRMSTPMVEEGQTSSILLMEDEESAVVVSEVIHGELIDGVADAAQVADGLHAELAERLEIELAKRLLKERELQVIAQVVQVPTKEDGGNDNDDDDEDSSICGLSQNCFFLVVAVLLLIIVGVVVGVVVASGGRDGDPPTMAPTASPTILSPSPKFTQLLNIIGADTSDIELLQNSTTLQYEALHWLANMDAWEVDIDSFTSQEVFVERYVLALLFLSTNENSWIKDYNFLTPTSVCEWKNGEGGVVCNEDGLFVALNLGKSKHEEVDWLVLFL
jgi:hypothetical protein